MRSSNVSVPPNLTTQIMAINAIPPTTSSPRPRRPQNSINPTTTQPKYPERLALKKIATMAGSVKAANAASEEYRHG